MIHRSLRSSFVVCSLAVAVLVGSSEFVSADQASEVLEQSGIQGGLIVHVGCGDGVLTAQLRSGPQFFVHGLERDAHRVQAIRQRLLDAGNYGPVSVDRWDGRHLPYADRLVNLLVIEDRADLSDSEIKRVLAPGGVALQRTANGWSKFVAPWPDALDEWTHYFHDADGNPVAEDTAVGPPKRLQWLGSPRWSRHHDHAASLNAMVSAGGRLFYIIDEGPRLSIQLPAQWRLVARDAFNGTILWKRPIARWNTWQYPLKSGPAHLLRRLVARGNKVWVTMDIDGPTEVLDAATGKTLATYEGSDFTREIILSKNTLLVVADTSPSPLPSWKRVSTYVWKNTRTANPQWGWKGTMRRVLAFDAETGEALWSHEAPVAPCSLAANGQRVVFHNGSKLVCLDQSSGKLVWESEEAPTALPVQTNTGPRVVLYGDVVLFAGNNGKISGWSLDDGKKRWEQRQLPSGHQSLKDLLVVDGLVWTGDVAGSSNSGRFVGYDPVTGEIERDFLPDVQVHWFHHRCYPIKASGKYFLVGRNGTEFVDLTTEHWQPNHWVRGGCIYGVMPCNGLMYAPMDSCGCQLEAKLEGLKALAPGPLPEVSEAQLSAAARLERGPAYGKAQGPKASSTDWPTYRHDEARSGSSDVVVGARLGKAWSVELGGRLTAPTFADGKLYIASVDRHTVYALDEKTGQVVWSWTAGGPVDSPPTYYRGFVLFGSADGYVYAVRSSDGQLAWRFRGAPLDRRVMAYEKLESAWPIHGSVLVHDGVLYCTAGRNMFLEGGIRFLRLDPMTGELLGEVVMDDKDPETGEDIHLAYCKKTQGNNMPVAHSDILSCDGKQIWMRSQKIDFSGKRLEIGLEDVNEQPADEFHMFCQVGFLDDSYFFRSYWTYGRRMTGGYGGWMKAGRLVPSGRILCVDQKRVYGFGRKPEFMTNSSVLEYQLFAADKAVTREAIDHINQAERRINARSRERNANSSDWLLRHFFPTRDLTAVNFEWTFEQPSVTVRAMAVTKDLLFAAGPPNYVDEREIYRKPETPDTVAKLQKQQEAIEGKHGGELWAVDKENGQVIGRYALEDMPVFDSLIAADSRLFLSTTNGKVICLATSEEALPSKDDRPAQIIWGEPEDPNYLLPEQVSKNDDFDRVRRCEVVESKLGYQLIPSGRDAPGLALLKLDKPITGAATLRTRLRVLDDPAGSLINGFVVLGNGTTDEALVKCGTRLKQARAMIVQGPLKGGQTVTKTLNLDVGQLLEVVVTVDVPRHKIAFQAGETTVETTLADSVDAITHIGYLTDNSVVEFAPIEVRGR